MNKVLLVGSGYSALPILLRLKKHFHVSVCGNAPDDPCHKYADFSYFFDYADSRKLLKLVKKEKFKFIIPSCNDYSYISASKVANILKFPGYDNDENVNTIHNKEKFREFTTKNKIPAPKYQKINSRENFNFRTFKFPLLLKPTSLSAGRGIFKLKNEKELDIVLKKISTQKEKNRMILEEFVCGSLHSHSVFFENGKIVKKYFADEYCTIYQYQVNSSNHPSLLSKNLKLKVEKIINNIIDRLKLNNGLLHTQFIINKNNIYIIEAMRRCPGDLFYHMIQLSTEDDYLGMYIAPFINNKISNFINKKKKNRYIIRHTISSYMDTNFYGYDFKLSSKSMRFIPLALAGQSIKKAPYEKSAILFSDMPNKKKLLVETKRFKNKIKVIESNKI